MLIEDPFIISDFLGHHHFINIIDYWQTTLIVLAFGCLFVLSLSHFLSLFIKNRIVLMASVTGILLAGHLLSTSGFLGNLGALLPVTYLRASSVADGSIKVLVNSNWCTLMLAVGILSLYSVILIALTLFVGQRKEVLA